MSRRGAGGVRPGRAHVHANAGWPSGAEQRGAPTPSADWYWPAGEPMGFTRWVQGDPDDEDGVEDGESNCLILDLGAGWWDRPCGNQYGFVCDRP